MLKIVALLFMIIDHACLFFYPDQAYWMRIIGQIAFPLFAYMIVQGHKFTSDKNQYLINLIFCAAITQPLYALIFPDLHRLNDLFTLLFGLILIILYEKYDYKAFLLFVPLVLMNVVSIYIIPVLIFYFFRDDIKKQFLYNIAFYIIAFYLSGTFYTLGGLLYVFLIIKPLPRFSINKYFFYVSYPLHFLIILIFLN